MGEGILARATRGAPRMASIVGSVDFDAVGERVRTATLEELKSGPLELGELVTRLRRRGALRHLQDLDDEEIAEELEDVLLVTDDTWVTGDGVVASTAVMLDEVNFSHLVTRSEMERGVLDATPDLVVIDFDTGDGLPLDTGGEIKLEFPLKGEPELDEHGSFVGPPGWLSVLSSPGMVVLHRSGRTVSLRVGSELASGDAEVEALRRAFDDHYQEGIAVEPTEILMDALCRDSSLFRSPVPPIRELLERAGLECLGAWVSRRGEEAKPPGAVRLERMNTMLGEKYGFDSCCRVAFDKVRDEWTNFLIRGDKTELRDLGRALSHGEVAPAFAEYVLENEPFGSEVLNEFALGVCGVGGKASAPGHYLRALSFERDGRTLEAELELQAAMAADIAFGPALYELAWYAADRGESPRAISLMRSAGAPPDDPELEYLSAQVPPPIKGVGRNDPCVCGSGRKFKSCCIRGVKVAIERRAGWLYHKVINFSLRPQNRNRLEELFEIAMDNAHGGSPEVLIPILVDLAAFAPEALEEFIEERGVLLPEDELVLVREWLVSRPLLWQVVDVEPGACVEVLDTLSGETVVVTEHTASQTLRLGDYLFARIVPAGLGHQIVGQPTHVPMVQRESLLKILGTGGDVPRLAAWVGQLWAPPRLVNYEKEELVQCRAVLRPTSTSWEVLSGGLDQSFGEPEESGWTEHIEIAGEDVIRCFLRRESDTLVVETNSVERFERVMNTVREIAVDIEIIEETRTDLRSADGPTGTEERMTGNLALEEISPEVAQAIAALMREKEDAWLSVSIPALGGLTPHQAADDPTRREDLIALLNEFDRHEDASPLKSFDVSRLRMQLGL